MGAGGRITFDPKKAGETIQLSFDFSSAFEDITSTINAASVTATVWSGTDAAPQDIISGAATIVTPVTSLPARKVLQTIIDGVPGVIYVVSCEATTASGLTAIQSGYLAILSENVP